MTLMFSHAASTLLWNINGWPQRRYSPGRTAITSDTAETLRDLTSPSGVSEGHSMPHWDGWRDRGPLTFLVFSNWEEILVIMPKADIYDKRDSTWVTPWRSILNLFRDQLPWRERRDMRPPGTTCAAWHPAVVLRGSAQELLICEIRVMIHIQKSKHHNQNLAKLLTGVFQQFNGYYLYLATTLDCFSGLTLSHQSRYFLKN